MFASLPVQTKIQLFFLSLTIWFSLTTSIDIKIHPVFNSKDYEQVSFFSLEKHLFTSEGLLRVRWLQTAASAELCTCAGTGAQTPQSIRSITRPPCCHMHLAAQPIIYCRLILVSRSVGTCTLACFTVIKGRRLKSGRWRAAGRGQKSTRAEEFPLILLGEAGKTAAWISTKEKKWCLMDVSDTRHTKGEVWQRGLDVPGWTATPRWRLHGREASALTARM